MSNTYKKGAAVRRPVRQAASAIRGDFADTLNRVAFGGERVVIHRRGKDLAALVPVEDLEFLRRLEDRIDLTKAKAALAEGSKGKPWSMVRKRLGQ